MLDENQLQQFVRDGYVRIDGAFDRLLADQAREILWRDTGCDPQDPSTWTRPVIRLGMYSQTPFVQAANTRVLHEAYDQLVGVDRWLAPRAIGTFPVRFPSADDPGDAGWHVDMSLNFDDADFMNWRANVFTHGRALLMLFLFSDVGDEDAPTRIRAGSHRMVARQLAPHGSQGMTLRELAANNFNESAQCAEVLATGNAGTVYLCHPFLVHSAQPHHGSRPRFMAQPPLLPKGPPAVFRVDDEFISPVRQAIRLAMTEVI